MITADLLATTKVLVRMKNRPIKFLSPRELYRAAPMDRIELIRAGLPAASMRTTATLLHISLFELAEILGIPRPTVDRQLKAGKRLSADHSERLIGILMLVGQVEEIIEDAGDNTVNFDAGAWVSAWIESPLPALGHRTPGELMDTVEGRQLVCRILAQSVVGSYV